MIPLQAVAIGTVTLVGTIVLLCRDPLRQAVVSGFYGAALVALFLVFQAPDVALSALVVGSAALPLMILLALARIRVTPSEEEKEG